MEFVKFSEVALGLMLVGLFASAADQFKLSQEQVKEFERRCENGDMLFLRWTWRYILSRTIW